ncbi:MADS-box transcription factor 50-like [Zingiber officinale]|uniref:MADS-box transcription factor 50-like n=1 Tax=Zingiber officinale TaxID=94328 RepID=UPI001C4B9835|nr:MADS-box transcription factor 50-like [Zingiber officinale]
MVRGKTQVKKIENPASRQVTFCKRRGCLLQKALELSVLCDAEIGLIVFSARGKLYEFASYRYEVANTSQKIEHLEAHKRKILGENLESCCLEELHELETTIENSLRSIRARQNQILEQQVVHFQKEESSLMKQNGLLREQCCKLEPELPFAVSKEAIRNDTATATQRNEVETELCIGCPGVGNSN